MVAGYNISGIYRSILEIRPPHVFATRRTVSLLRGTPTKQTKIICSSMHNDEICSVCVGLLYCVLRVRDNKQTHLNSSSWSGCSQGAVWCDHTRL